MPSIIKKETFNSDETYYPLQGSQYEYLPWDARLEFAITAQQGSNAKGTAVMNIFSGSDILVQNGDVPMKSSPAAATSEIRKSSGQHFWRRAHDPHRRPSDARLIHVM